MVQNQLMEAHCAEIDRARPILSNLTANWTNRVETVKNLANLSSQINDDEQLSSFGHHLSTLKEALTIQLTDLRSAVVKEFCLAIGKFSIQLGDHISELAEFLIPQLVKLLQNTKEVFSLAAHQCISTMIENITSQKLFHSLFEGTTHKNPFVRTKVQQYMKIYSNLFTPEQLESHQQTFFESLRRGIDDSSEPVRNAASLFYWHLCSKYPESTKEYFQTLTSAKQTKLLKAKKLLIDQENQSQSDFNRSTSEGSNPVVNSTNPSKPTIRETPSGSIPPTVIISEVTPSNLPEKPRTSIRSNPESLSKISSSRTSIRPNQELESPQVSGSGSKSSIKSRTSILSIENGNSPKALPKPRTSTVPRLSVTDSQSKLPLRKSIVASPKSIKRPSASIRTSLRPNPDSPPKIIPKPRTSIRPSLISDQEPSISPPKPKFRTSIRPTESTPKIKSNQTPTNKSGVSRRSIIISPLPSKSSRTSILGIPSTKIQTPLSQKRNKLHRCKPLSLSQVCSPSALDRGDYFKTLPGALHESTLAPTTIWIFGVMIFYESHPLVIKNILESFSDISQRFSHHFHEFFTCSWSSDSDLIDQVKTGVKQQLVDHFGYFSRFGIFGGILKLSRSTDKTIRFHAKDCLRKIFQLHSESSVFLWCLEILSSLSSENQTNNDSEIGSEFGQSRFEDQQQDLLLILQGTKMIFEEFLFPISFQKRVWSSEEFHQLLGVLSKIPFALNFRVAEEICFSLVQKLSWFCPLEFSKVSAKLFDLRKLVADRLFLVSSHEIQLLESASENLESNPDSQREMNEILIGLKTFSYEDLNEFHQNLFVLRREIEKSRLEFSVDWYSWFPEILNDLSKIFGEVLNSSGNGKESTYLVATRIIDILKLLLERFPAFVASMAPIENLVEVLFRAQISLDWCLEDISQCLKILFSKCIIDKKFCLFSWTQTRTGLEIQALEWLLLLRELRKDSFSGVMSCVESSFLAFEHQDVTIFEKILSQKMGKAFDLL